VPSQTTSQRGCSHFCRVIHGGGKTLMRAAAESVCRSLVGGEDSISLVPVQVDCPAGRTVNC
jgi:hypothetical protein